MYANQAWPRGPGPFGSINSRLFTTQQQSFGPPQPPNYYGTVPQYGYGHYPYAAGNGSQNGQGYHPQHALPGHNVYGMAPFHLPHGMQPAQYQGQAPPRRRSRWDVPHPDGTGSARISSGDPQSSQLSSLPNRQIGDYPIAGGAVAITHRPQHELATLADGFGLHPGGARVPVRVEKPSTAHLSDFAPSALATSESSCGLTDSRTLKKASASSSDCASGEDEGRLERDDGIESGPGRPEAEGGALEIECDDDAVNGFATLSDVAFPSASLQLVEQSGAQAMPAPAGARGQVEAVPRRQPSAKSKRRGNMTLARATRPLSGTGEGAGGHDTSGFASLADGATDTAENGFATLCDAPDPTEEPGSSTQFDAPLANPIYNPDPLPAAVGSNTGPSQQGFATLGVDDRGFAALDNVNSAPPGLATNDRAQRKRERAVSSLAPPIERIVLSVTRVLPALLNQLDCAAPSAAASSDALPDGFATLESRNEASHEQGIPPGLPVTVGSPASMRDASTPHSLANGCDPLPAAGAFNTGPTQEGFATLDTGSIASAEPDGFASMSDGGASSHRAQRKRERATSAAEAPVERTVISVMRVLPALIQARAPLADYAASSDALLDGFATLEGLKQQALPNDRFASSETGASLAVSDEGFASLPVAASAAPSPSLKGFASLDGAIPDDAPSRAPAAKKRRAAPAWEPERVVVAVTRVIPALLRAALEPPASASDDETTGDAGIDDGAAAPDVSFQRDGFASLTPPPPLGRGAPSPPVTGFATLDDAAHAPPSAASASHVFTFEPSDAPLPQLDFAPGEDGFASLEAPPIADASGSTAEPPGRVEAQPRIVDGAVSPPLQEGASHASPIDASHAMTLGILDHQGAATLEAGYGDDTPHSYSSSTAAQSAAESTALGDPRFHLEVSDGPDTGAEVRIDDSGTSAGIDGDCAAAAPPAVALIIDLCSSSPSSDSDSSISDCEGRTASVDSNGSLAAVVQVAVRASSVDDTAANAGNPAAVDTGLTVDNLAGNAPESASSDAGAIPARLSPTHESGSDGDEGGSVLLSPPGASSDDGGSVIDLVTSDSDDDSAVVDAGVQPGTAPCAASAPTYCAATDSDGSTDANDVAKAAAFASAAAREARKQMARDAVAAAAREAHKQSMRDSVLARRMADEEAVFAAIRRGPSASLKGLHSPSAPYASSASSAAAAPARSSVGPPQPQAPAHLNAKPRVAPRVAPRIAPGSGPSQRAAGRKLEAAGAASDYSADDEDDSDAAPAASGDSHHSGLKRTVSVDVAYLYAPRTKQPVVPPPVGRSHGSGGGQGIPSAPATAAPRVPEPGRAVHTHARFVASAAASSSLHSSGAVPQPIAPPAASAPVPAPVQAPPASSSSSSSSSAADWAPGRPAASAWHSGGGSSSGSGVVPGVSEQDALLSHTASKVAAEMEAHRRWRAALNAATDRVTLGATASSVAANADWRPGMQTAAATPSAAAAAAAAPQGPHAPSPSPPGPPPPTRARARGPFPGSAPAPLPVSIPDSDISLDLAIALALRGDGSAAGDAYGVMGLARTADTPGVTRRYRLLARLLHPDKASQQDLGEAQAALAAEAFKAVARAHALLVRGEG